MRKSITAPILVLLFFAGPVFAQGFSASAFGGNLSVSLSPQYPQPGQIVRLRANGGSLDLDNSAIIWRAGGKIIAQGTGVTSSDVTAGALGSETDIELDVETPDGTVISAQATLAPTELDVLVGSDSYVPPFYLGRSMPSAGTNLVLQAVARFKRTDGTLIPDSSITYTWRRNNEAMAGVSGRGKAAALVSAPHLFASDTITVDAVSSDGTRAGRASVLVPTADPVLDLYEDHPLYGTLYNRALGASAFIPESEMTFVGVPYFAQTFSPTSRSLSYEWRVNNAKITPSVSAPNEITINAQNSSGRADISLEVTHATNFYLDMKGEWIAVLSSGSGSSASDPFRNSGQ